MASRKFSICLICDKEGFKWIPFLIKEWKIKYMYCNDEELKNCLVSTFGLVDTITNTNNNALKYIEGISNESIDLLFLALSTSTFHEFILEYVISQKKFFYIFSSNIPTWNIKKFEKYKSLINNFNPYTNIIYDVKEEFKNINKQFYWNIYNPILNERVFHNLKTGLNELGHIYGAQLECTFIPFTYQNEEVSNILFLRTILIMSLMEFLFDKPKSILAKCYSVNNEAASVQCVVANLLFESLNCNITISVNTFNKIFNLKVYGDNGFIEVTYSTEHNCFQMKRCLNHYEYPNLFVEDAHQNALNELKYFIEEQVYTNKYINIHISAIYTSICLWKSNGTNIMLDNENNNNNDDNIDMIHMNKEHSCIAALKV
ncbi:hypothetical protein PFAG_04037 [Plasmodium falciparum Santa Lucia]|uniref:Gfo/Idh/MocA-like oxidoreductase N-terminal domain-containing protein n=1 Tax=Plasmodium falciparum Santa Lucia TaxID=478859 RepID=W7FSC4_PLAFA|nr:hypothetical protein PFAG_04037 [Plasmodium falciparum Santa Lucia]